MSFSSLSSSMSSSSFLLSSKGIRDVAMREIRNQIIIIHKDSTKRFNQLYRMLRSNPHLGHQFYLRSWFHYSMLYFPLVLLWSYVNSIRSEFSYYIWSYPPITISNILQIIILLLDLFLVVFFLVPYISGCVYLAFYSSFV